MIAKFAGTCLVSHKQEIGERVVRAEAKSQKVRGAKSKIVRESEMQRVRDAKRQRAREALQCTPTDNQLKKLKIIEIIFVKFQNILKYTPKRLKRGGRCLSIAQTFCMSNQFQTVTVFK